MSDAESAAVVEYKAQTYNSSRQALEEELSKLEINPEFFKTLTVDQLADLLFGLNRAMNANAGSAAANKIAKKVSSGLSSIDKKILKALLESNGSPSSLQLSRELDIPITTVQRRRKRLEDEFVNEFYSLQYEKFGKRQVTFIVSLGAVDKNAIANEILGLEKVIAVARTFGDGADLKIEAILESNQEFMETSEKIKAIQGIQKVCWFESLEILGRKKELDQAIVESA
ncbi:transcriptional regulator [Candidatus Nitrososphaera evergladensis SR1]|uniref:Transcriptional regulator n=1 Tax=Candidatus Nitrososphaera evergladensis SR1 TaxID=1459636 RepID=A0A075MNJ4_9ARCH|nr:Lrp/AsnC family transcriptional regulator [Candidatus Nitrososphaera evergladensis]AIF82773.1 transcriptional regulator [Candidatus Nitrososphaera evergladensis SR1]